MAIYPVLALLATAVFLRMRRRQTAQTNATARVRLSRPLLALAVAGAIPLVVYALGEADLQRTGEPLHAPLDHWAGMAAVALMLPLLAASAALREPGWRVPAWSAGIGAALLGIASVVMPEQASALGTGWGAAAIAGGALFVAAAEYESRRVEVAAATRSTPA